MMCWMRNEPETIVPEVHVAPANVTVEPLNNITVLPPEIVITPSYIPSPEVIINLEIIGIGLMILGACILAAAFIMGRK